MQRVGNGFEGFDRASDLDHAILFGHIVRAGFDGQFESLVIVHLAGGKREIRNAVELPGNRPDLGHAAAAPW
jgi:hypothetical protein